MSHITASEKTIEISLKGSFFRVPPFQREYVWEAPQVSAFWDDIFSHFEAGQDDGRYFIGSIITYENASDSSTLDVIDGQQRLITTVILLSALRDFIIEAEGKAPDWLTTLICEKSADAGGNDFEKPRVQVDYADGNQVLRCLIAAGDIRLVSGRTSTFKNLMQAYNHFSIQIRECFETRPQEAKMFAKHFVSSVSLISVVTGGLSSALRIFETINARGKGLNDSDLLKNLLFLKKGKASDSEIQDGWRTFVANFNDTSIKPLKFIRDFATARFPEGRINENSVFEVFEDREAFTKLGGSLSILEQFKKYAPMYNYMLSGRTPNGQSSVPMTVLGHLNGGKHQSYMNVLLPAAMQMDDAEFNSFVTWFGDLILCLKIEGRSAQEIRGMFPDLRRSLVAQSEANDAIQHVRSLVAERIPTVASKATGLKLTDKPSRAMISALLARVYWYVENYSYGAASQSVDAYLKYQIEHVLPQKPSEEALLHFGMHTSDEYGIELEELVPDLGNLVLLDKSSNSSGGNDAFPEKVELYASSNLLLTQALVKKVHPGRNTAQRRCLEEVAQFADWNQMAIDQRRRDYVRLFKMYLERA